jgi:hypothetical protein
LQRFDEDLAKAVSKDMSTYIGEVMSSISFRRKKIRASEVATT